MTGWASRDLSAQAAGHDINYVALTGALHAIVPATGRCTPQSRRRLRRRALYLVMGVLASLLERARSAGRHRRCGMVDGAASLMSIFYVMQQIGFWRESAGNNFLDGGAPFYGTYETSGRQVRRGRCDRAQFWRLLARLGIEAATLGFQHGPHHGRHARAVAAAFRTRTPSSGASCFEGSEPASRRC